MPTETRDDMVERAAKAIADKWLEKVDDHTVRVGPAVIARAALSAALDPEDEKLVAFVSNAVRAAKFEGQSREERRLIATRAAIQALRQLALGGGNG